MNCIFIYQRVVRCLSSGAKYDTMNKSTPQTRDHSVNSGLGNITNVHHTVILGATL